jgi:hypothetical protein
MTMNKERRFAAQLATVIALMALVAPGRAQQPTFSISDVSSAEGSAGRKTFTFTVTLSGANPAVEHRVTYRTADGTATAATVARTSTTPISIPTLGTATPYPVVLDVAGLSGTIDDVAVRLDHLTHTYPADLDILLVGPGGQTSMFMSDNGGWDDVANIDVTFRDGAPPVPERFLTSNTFSPFNISPSESVSSAPTLTARGACTSRTTSRPTSAHSPDSRSSSRCRGRATTFPPKAS